MVSLLEIMSSWNGVQAFHELLDSVASCRDVLRVHVLSLFKIATSFSPPFDGALMMTASIGSGLRDQNVVATHVNSLFRFDCRLIYT